jgi:hypothetical protein
MNHLLRGSPGEGLGEEMAEDLTLQFDHVFDDDLEASLIEDKKVLDAAHARLALKVAEFDKRQIADREHALSTRSWLRHMLRVSGREASALLQQGRALMQMPLVQARAVSGDVTADGVRLLTTARTRQPDAFLLHEPVFAEIATWLTTADLRKAIVHWEQQVDHASAIGIVESQRNRRRLSHHQTFEGMWAGMWDLDPQSGHVVDTALRSHADPGNLDASDVRTVTQRRADAMVDICRFWLDHNDVIISSGGEKPHVTVTVDYSILTGTSDRLPEIDGAAISLEVIRQLTCDAGIVRMVVNGDSEPLDVGRRVRTVTSAIRRALDYRDGGCAWTGCDAPVGWCDAHHIVHWADGGETSLANMKLLCRDHHTRTHEAEARDRAVDDDGTGWDAEP